MTPDSVAPSLSPIPVSATMGAALRLVRAEWRPLLKMLALPCLVIAIAGVFLPSDMRHAASAYDHVASFIFLLVNLFLQPWLTVATFRFLILGEAPGALWPRYQPRMWRYLGKSLLMWFVLAAPIVVLGLVCFAAMPAIAASLCALLFVLAASLASGRLLLALPASAVADDNSLKTAWHRTRGQALRILTIKFLGQLLLIVPFLLSTVISLALGQISTLAAKLIILWPITVLQLGLLLPIDALLYGYFYDGMVITRTEHNESHGQ